jgi:hypothetical protein
MTARVDSAIRRHADGSIDTGFNMAQGRAAGGRQAYRVFGALRDWAGRIASRPVGHLDMTDPTGGLRPNPVD